MRRGTLLSVLVVSWICLCLGSAEANVQSEQKHAARTEPVGITNIQLCDGNALDILVHGGVTEYVTICGENFEAQAENDLRVDPVGGFETDLVEITDNRIVARLPHNGAGQKLKVKVGTRSSGTFIFVPDLFVSYPQPIVTGVVRDPNFKRVTMEHVIIYGLNFENPSPLVHITASVGGWPCVNVHHVSNKEIRCTVTGYGANREVIVIVNGQSSAVVGTVVGATTVRYDFLNHNTPGFECTPPFGAVDVFNPDMCNCWSGSAPYDNLLATECSVHSECAGRITTQPQVSQYPPTRPETTFANDKLLIKQTIPIVKNRRDTIIQFVVPNLNNEAVPDTPAGTIGLNTCFYPGNLWAKKINNLDCLDEYYGAMPWSQHEACGFVEHTAASVLESDPPVREFKSNLVTTFTETFKKQDGSIFFRKVSHSFLVTVSFLRQVVVLTHTPVTVYIADQDAPTSLSIRIVQDALYDVASKATIINFETTLVWPYEMDYTQTLTGVWTPAAGSSEVGPVVVTAIIPVDPRQSGQLVCDQTQDSDCEQHWLMTILTKPDPALAQVCDLRGSISFNTQNLLCRDYETLDLCQGAPNTTFTIAIGKTDLCDPDAADATDASKGLALTLDTFYDAEYQVPQNIFQTGDMVYFRLIVVDPSSTIDQITFQRIEVRSSTTSGIDDELFRQDVSGSALSEAFFLEAAQVNVTRELRMGQPFLGPSDEGELRFNFRLLRPALEVVNTLSSINSDEMTKQLTVEATIDILYHGNNNAMATKRNVISSTTDRAAMTHAQISFFDTPADDEEELMPHNNDATADDEASANGLFSISSAPSVFASSAAVCVVAGVAALVLA